MRATLPPRVLTVVRALGWDVGLPGAVYGLALAGHTSTYHSLVAGAIAAGLRTCWGVARRRRLEPLSLLLLVTFGVGFALTFATNDPQLILLKDVATSTILGAAFLVSCLVKRPLAYYAARSLAAPSDASDLVVEKGRSRWYTVSVVWGAVLLIDVALRVTCIFLLPLGGAFVVSQILMIAGYAVLIGWSAHFAKACRRRTPVPVPGL